MAQIKKILEKLVLIIVLISLIISFCAIPSSYADLDLEEGDFYYSGTQEGQYTVTQGIFAWLLSKIGDIADWLLGIITMGFRMIFVGWTALIEKMLTWALESTSGVDVEGNPVKSSTDLTAITDSADNLTIEAIVYNHVFALDANMFKYERSIDDLKYSGTGHLLKCSKSEDLEADVTECCGTDGNCNGECECNGKCKDCSLYQKAIEAYNKQQEEGTDPLIVQVKKLGATWYYIILTLSLVAMLIVLIVVGIKMALSTAATNKAAYKKMLTDWLVGMIIMFSMHYIMLFAIYTNESLVGIIEKTANRINSVQMMQLAEKDSGKGEGVKYSDSQIEQKVYEAVRTRAYDAKLINGISGTIMYMTLVYFAIRYTIVYLKRFFTILVLTIMAPSVGVGYAMQKALTGKQMSLKTWLTEYFLNTIIQTVHALIYAIFISQALVLSLESISGVIVALILMNYTLKADQLFRKIFKISTGMVEDTQNAAESLKQGIASTAIGGKAAVKTLTNSPYTNTIKGAAKAAVAAPFIAATEIKAAKNLLNKNSSSNDETSDDSSNSQSALQFQEPDNSNNSDNQSGQGGNLGGGSSQTTYASGKPRRTDEQLLGEGEESLKKKLEIAEKNLMSAQTDEEQKKAIGEFAIASDEYNRFKKMTVPTTIDIIIGHEKRVIEIDNNFVLEKNVTAERFYLNPLKYILGDQSVLKGNLISLRGAIWGNKYLDSETGKMKNDGSGYYSRFTPSNLFGLTDNDKKLLAAQLNLSAAPLIGFASLMFGMGTLVANPKLGMMAIAAGAGNIHKGLGRATGVRSYTGKLTFGRFAPGTKKNMCNAAIKRAQKEFNDMNIASINERHPNFAAALKAGKITAISAIVAGSIAAVPLTLSAPAALMAQRFMSKTNIGESLRNANYQIAKQEKEQEKKFREETRNILKADFLSQIDQQMKAEDQMMDSSEEEFKEAIYDSFGYEYDKETGNVRKKGRKTEAEKAKEEFGNQLDKKLKDEGIDEKVVAQNIPKETELTNTDVKFIDKEIENIVEEFVAEGKADFTDSQNIEFARRKLSTKLINQGIIKEIENFDKVFSKNGFKNILDQKSKAVKARLEIAEQALDVMTSEDKEIIEEIVKDSAKKGNVTDYTQIDASKIVKKLNKKKSDIVQSTKAGTSSTNGSQPNIGLSNEQAIVYKQKVEDYLLGLQIGKTINNDSEYKKKKRIESRVESQSKKRERKLSQVLAMTVDDEVDNATDIILEQVENIKETGGIISDRKGNTVEITPEQSTRIVEALLAKKGLEYLNTEDMKSGELKKGSYAYMSAVKETSEAEIKLGKRKMDYYNSPTYGDSDYESKLGTYTKEEIDEAKEIEKDIAELKRKLEIKKIKKKKAGPIFDENKDFVERYNLEVKRRRW